ncbi:hypothetical protein C8Q70DRAFT_762666 [Cubamyces menziesii]|nr:hypothetical protein C8Q70DRAFT_762666 [Cubamyces menziesii]
MHLTELRKAATSRIHNAGGTNATGMSSQNKLSRGLPSSEQRIDTPSEKDVDDPHRSTEKTGSITPRKTRSEGTAATKGVPIPETTTERSTGKTEIPAKGSSADASNHSRKRHADEDIKAELDSPARKRPKEGPQEGIHEVIELSD